MSLTMREPSHAQHSPSMRIVRIAMPVFGAQLSFSLLNLVDTAMVGRLGSASLAAMGMASYVFFVTQFMFVGLANAVQTRSAWKKGEQDTQGAQASLVTGIWLALGLGLVLTGLFHQLAPAIFHALLSDPEVASLATGAFRVRTFGYVALGIFFSFRGFWTAMERTSVFLAVNIAMHACNLILNYLLIYGGWGIPPLGLEGSAWGSTIAVYIGAAVFIVHSRTVLPRMSVLFAAPSLEHVKGIARIALPSGLQQLIFWAGIATFTTLIGWLGTDALAIANILINIAMVASLLALSFGMAAGSLVGDAIGGKRFDDAKAWARRAVWLSVAVLAVLAAPLAVAPTGLLSLFLHEQGAVAMASATLATFSLFLLVEGPLFVYMQSLVSAGDMKSVVLYNLLFQWVFFLPSAYLLVAHFHAGLLTLWVAYGIYRCVTAMALGYTWRQGRWLAMHAS